MEKLEIGIIIQARTGSKRLPAKVLNNIGSTSMLQFLIKRLKKINLIDHIIVATSNRKSDDLIVEHLKKNKNIKIFRGSLNNVLQRFYECAREYKLDVVIRVTADDPFKDPEVIKKGLRIFLENNYDYVSNTIIPSYPEGIDIEIFSYESLKKAFTNAKKNSEKLHVTPYIWKNKEFFNVYNFKDSKDNSSVRLTCDYEEDFVFLNKIYSYTKSDDFTYKDVLNIINTYKIKHTRQVKRNEGYLQDINNENGYENENK